MKLGRIIGKVVSSKKIDSFNGIKLLLIQPIDENLKKQGDPIVAFDTIGACENEIIYYETSKEAGRVLETVLNPCDAAVMAIVDEINLGEVK